MIHSLQLSNLNPGSTYHFRIRIEDGLGGQATTADNTFSTAPLDSSIRSDDFFSSALDAGIWTSVDPTGDAQFSLDGTRLIIEVPAGTSHDVWNGGINGAQVLQNLSNEDFEVEIKFESAVTEPYQVQGILVKQDDFNALRFDFVSSAAGSTRVFSAAVQDTTTVVQFADVDIGYPGAPIYMRVRRVGDLWTQAYSIDGFNWVEASQFTWGLTATQIGPFAGNAGSPAPAFAASIVCFPSPQQ